MCLNVYLPVRLSGTGLQGLHYFQERYLQLRTKENVLAIYSTTTDAGVIATQNISEHTCHLFTSSSVKLPPRSSKYECLRLSSQHLLGHRSVCRTPFSQRALCLAPSRAGFTHPLLQRGSPWSPPHGRRETFLPGQKVSTPWPLNSIQVSATKT